MRIKEVGYINFKGSTNTQAFERPATILWGNNFTGKTTVLDAVKVALLGYHPSLDKNSTGLKHLASADQFSVTVRFDTDGTGALPPIVSRDFVNGVAQNKSAPAVPVAMLDANDYFGRSARGKIELLFQAARIDTTTTTLQLAKQLLAEIGVNVLSLHPDEEIQRWVEMAMNWCEEKRSGFSAEAKRLRGALMMSARDVVAKAPTMALSLPECEKRLKAARANLEAALSIVHPKANPAAAKSTVDLMTLQARLALRKGHLLESEAEAKKNKCPTCGQKLPVKAQKRLAANVATFRADVDALEADIIKAQNQVKRASNRADAKTEKAEEDVAELREEIAQLERNERALLAEAERDAFMQESRNQMDDAIVWEKRWGDAKMWLLGKKQALLRDTLMKIEIAASHFTKNVLPQLAFRNGELGMYRNAHWVSHETFSGSEQVIAFAVLQAALASQSPARLLIVDELGRLDPTHKQQFLWNVVNAIRHGLLDQFIGVDVTESKFDDELLGSIHFVDAF